MYIGENGPLIHCIIERLLLYQEKIAGFHIIFNHQSDYTSQNGIV
jgi:hypothetical protein